MLKKFALVGLLVAGVVLLAAGPSDAWYRGGVYVGVGPYPYWWYGAPYYAYPSPYYAYPPPYTAYPPSYYSYPPPVAVEQPPAYIEREPAPSPAAPSEPQAYWYYCASANAYYPTVPSCPEAWVRVPPRPQP